MALKTMDQALLFIAMFTFLFSLFAGQQTGNPSLTGVSTIQAPTLAPLPPSIKCSQFDFGCNATAGIAQATAYIGWAIVNLPVILVFVIVQMTSYLDLAISFGTSPSFNSNGIPFGQFFFVFVVFLVISGAFKIFRGVAEGL